LYEIYIDLTDRKSVLMNDKICIVFIL